MAGGNLSPRQKMINMMYLVLTALLALNVSKEILDSFVTINNGLETTKGTLKEKVDGMYGTFAQYAQENQQKYGAAWSEAQQVQKMATDLVKTIDDMKARSIMAAEGIKDINKVLANDTILNLKYITAKDNVEGMTHELIGSDESKPKTDEGSAAALRVKLEDFREKIKALALKDPKNPNQALVANVTKMFDFPKEKEGGSTGVETTWEVKNFFHVPLAAGVTMLSKLQSDIRNAENEAVNYLLGNVEQKTFKFNTLTPIVRPLSSYVTEGSKYQADIFLGAYDNQNAPTVIICGPGERVDTASTPPKIVGGPGTKLNMDGAMAKLDIPASGAGVKTITGLIIFKPVGGEEQVRYFETTYEVAKSNLVVSPTKMNVFYRGVENPVSVSVSGYSDKDVQPSMTGGVISKSAEGWVVKPGKETEATVTATVTNPDGTKKTMTGQKFRVKNVPNPTPYFAGKSLNDETVKKTELTAAQGVIAKMENFEFDLKFEVVEYKISTTINGNYLEKLCKGAALTGEAKEVLQKVKSGQKVYVEGIKARGPDGTVRALGALSFKVI